MIIAPLLVGLAAIAALAGQSSALLGLKSRTSVVVDSPELAVNKIVGQLCDPKQQSSHQAKQISKLSTIRWLNKNLNQLGSSDETSGEEVRCLYRYMKPLIKLNEIFEARKPDACSDRHISLVEEFHLRYIEPPLIAGKSWNPQGAATFPDPLRWFFIHYATELSHLCQKNFVDNLELMSMSSKVEYEKLFSGFNNKFIASMQKLLGLPEHIERFEDFFLMWNTLDAFSRRQNEPAANIDVNPITGDPIRLRLKVKDAGAIRDAQRKCRNDLKPIYGETALSPMRLISMGYNNNHGKRAPVNKNFQNWYGIAQTCDFLLSLKTYEDSSLGHGEMVMVTRAEVPYLSKDEADSTPCKPIAFEKLPASFEDEDRLVSVQANDPNKLWSTIRSNAKSRLRDFKRILRKSFSKSESKEQLKNLYISKRSKDGQRFVKSPSNWADEALEETSKWSPDSEDDDDNDTRLEEKETWGQWWDRSIDEHPALWYHSFPLLLVFGMFFIFTLAG